MVVFDSISLPVDDHQPRIDPMAERLLGDQSSRQFVIEVE
jgi:hypothetical protein